MLEKCTIKLFLKYSFIFFPKKYDDTIVYIKGRELKATYLGIIKTSNQYFVMMKHYKIEEIILCVNIQKNRCTNFYILMYM